MAGDDRYDFAVNARESNATTLAEEIVPHALLHRAIRLANRVAVIARAPEIGIRESDATVRTMPQDVPRPANPSQRHNGDSLRSHPEAMMVRLLLVLQVGTLSAQRTANAVYDRVILGGHVMDPASKLDAVRNIGLLGGGIAVITTHAIGGRDTVDARGLAVAPCFIDLPAHGPHPEPH